MASNILIDYEVSSSPSASKWMSRGIFFHLQKMGSMSILSFRHTSCSDSRSERVYTFISKTLFGKLNKIAEMTQSCMNLCNICPG